MKNTTFKQTTILLLLVLLNSWIALPRIAAQDLRDLDKYIDHARQAWEIPGMAVGIIRDNKILLLEGYGTLAVNRNDKVDGNTVFAIASNTKAMTAAILAMLDAEGTVSLKDPVQKYLPDFRLYDPWVSAQMNLTDLLCHRSGLATFSGDLIWYGSDWGRREIIRRARYLKPVYPFRDGYGYSNIMFLTAGEVAGVAAGSSWDELIASRLLTPLGMNRTTTSIQQLDFHGNVVMGHTRSGKEIVPVDWVNWDNIAPAGGVNSCAADMLKWIRMLLNNGKLPDGQVLLSEEALQNMWTIHNPQAVSKRTRERWPSIHFRGYGLGFGLMDYQGRKIISHGGAVDGQISRVVLVPEEKLGFVILTNSNNALPTYLMYEILDRFFDVEEQDWAARGLQQERKYRQSRAETMKQFLTPQVENTHPTLNTESYTGIYSGKVYGNVEVFLKDGQLRIRFIPTPMFTGTLEHWQYDTYILTLDHSPSLPRGKVQFILDEDGKVDQMKINIPNPDFDFGELDLFKTNR